MTFPVHWSCTICLAWRSLAERSKKREHEWTTDKLNIAGSISSRHLPPRRDWTSIFRRTYPSSYSHHARNVEKLEWRQVFFWTFHCHTSNLKLNVTLSNNKHLRWMLFGCVSDLRCIFLIVRGQSPALARNSQSMWTYVVLILHVMRPWTDYSAVKKMPVGWIHTTCIGVPELRLLTNCLVWAHHEESDVASRNQEIKGLWDSIVKDSGDKNTRTHTGTRFSTCCDFRISATMRRPWLHWQDNTFKNSNQNRPQSHVGGVAPQ